MAILPDPLPRTLLHQVGLRADSVHLAGYKLAFILHAEFGARVDAVALALALEKHAFVGVAIGHCLKTVSMEFVIEECSFIGLSVDVTAKRTLARDHTLDELTSEDITVGLGCRPLPMRLPLHPTTIVCLAVRPRTPTLPMWLVIFPLADVTPAIWPLSGPLAMPLSFLPVALVALPRRLQEDAPAVWLIIEGFTCIYTPIGEAHPD